MSKRHNEATDKQTERRYYYYYAVPGVCVVCVCMFVRKGPGKGHFDTPSYRKRMDGMDG